MEPLNEKIFYQNREVMVTRTRFVANNKTYAMSNISSVSIRRIDRSIMGEIILIVLGAILLATDLMPAGIIMIVIAIALFFLRKDSFSVRINSNSGEADGFISKDEEVIKQIVNAVNDAIIYRG